MKLIDTHCHLNHDYAPKTSDDLVKEAHAAGLLALITIGTELATIPEIQKISETHPKVFHTVGIHPHDAVELKDGYLDVLEKAASHPKCKAIGEIGLDYYYNHSPKEIQIQRFEEQLDLAARINKPIVIHCRDAEEDLVQCLSRYTKKIKPENPPGIIHCFSGTEKFGRDCLALGFYISLSGILTFKKAEDIRNAVAQFPLDRLLVETDSPYLAPMPHRGKKCEPAMIIQTAKKLAEIKHVSEDEISRITTENAQRVFGLSATELQ